MKLTQSGDFTQNIPEEYKNLDLRGLTGVQLRVLTEYASWDAGRFTPLGESAGQRGFLPLGTLCALDYKALRRYSEKVGYISNFSVSAGLFRFMILESLSDFLTTFSTGTLLGRRRTHINNFFEVLSVAQADGLMTSKSVRLSLEDDTWKYLIPLERYLVCGVTAEPPSPIQKLLTNTYPISLPSAHQPLRLSRGCAVVSKYLSTQGIVWYFDDAVSATDDGQQILAVPTAKTWMDFWSPVDFAANVTLPAIG